MQVLNFPLAPHLAFRVCFTCLLWLCVFVGRILWAYGARRWLVASEVCSWGLTFGVLEMRVDLMKVWDNGIPSTAVECAVNRRSTRVQASSVGLFVRWGAQA